MAKTIELTNEALVQITHYRFRGKVPTSTSQGTAYLRPSEDQVLIRCDNGRTVRVDAAIDGSIAIIPTVRYFHTDRGRLTRQPSRMEIHLAGTKL